MKKRTIDKDLNTLQSFLKKMEPLESWRLKKWRALLVIFFSLGFLLAMLWVFYNGYESQTYAEVRSLKNIALVEYVHGGINKKILTEPLFIPITQTSVLNRQKIDLGNWDKFKSSQNGNLLIFQTADKKTVQPGDVVTFNVYVIAFPGGVYNDLTLYNLLPKRSELIWDKTMSTDNFKQNGRTIQWIIGALDVKDKQEPVLIVKKFHLKVK